MRISFHTNSKIAHSEKSQLIRYTILIFLLVIVTSLAACGKGDPIKDTTPPDAPVFTTSNGQAFNTATPVITGSAEASSTVELFDTNGTTSLGTASANASGNWSITTATLSEGEHTLTAKATDAAGNTSEASESITISIATADTTAPEAPAITTVNGQAFNTATPVITGSAEAGSTVELFDTNGTISLGTASANASGNWSITTATLSEGEQ
ncbi:MAG: Ig-like domain-containing protein [Gammaproteobacteria bacterium]|nr:Ig-like domain-containing protein [Gammaproteobacteria bacterium]